MSTIPDSIHWFKTTFADEIQDATADMPFTVDHLAALAIQETGYIWGTLAAKGLPCDEILSLCTGDTLDKPHRSAFPVDKMALLAADQGQQMFAIARTALELLGSNIEGYARVAKNPDKFCHGYGIFQLDLQFFRTASKRAFFLDKRWYFFADCLQQCLTSLQSALFKAYPGGVTTLTDEQMVYVAIAYNCGHVDLTKGFKQGYKSSDDLYYGEAINDYLHKVHKVD